MHLVDNLSKEVQQWVRKTVIFQSLVQITPKNLALKTVLLLKDIYREAFMNLGHFITRNFFKLFAWFSFVLLLVVLYAFLFRVATGFAFD